MDSSSSGNSLKQGWQKLSGVFRNIIKIIIF